MAALFSSRPFATVSHIDKDQQWIMEKEVRLERIRRGAYSAHKVTPAVNVVKGLDIVYCSVAP